MWGSSSLVAIVKRQIIYRVKGTDALSHLWYWKQQQTTYLCLEIATMPAFAPVGTSDVQ